MFENRGPEIGATITHPHGPIYAFDHVPERQLALLRAGWKPDADPGDRLVTASDGWTVSVPVASPFPIALSISPDAQVSDLASLGDDARTALDGGDWSQAWFNIDIVSPWRASGIQRFIAAAEVATGEYFNPVVPEDLAATLRSR